MSYQSREVRDLLERLEGKLSRVVLRGLRGSNTHSATRLMQTPHSGEGKRVQGAAPGGAWGAPTFLFSLKGGLKMY